MAATVSTIRATIPAVKRAHNPMPGSVLALRGSVRVGCRSVEVGPAGSDAMTGSDRARNRRRERSGRPTPLRKRVPASRHLVKTTGQRSGSLHDLDRHSGVPPGPRQARPDDRLRIERALRGNDRHVPGRDTSVSLLVMNSSKTGTPSLVLAMPRRIAGTMSSALVMRSPWPPKARAIAA